MIHQSRVSGRVVAGDLQTGSESEPWPFFPDFPAWSGGGREATFVECPWCGDDPVGRQSLPESVQRPILCDIPAGNVSSMNAPDFHCFRSDPIDRWRGIAAVLESQPEAWEWALANIERWLSQGFLHPAPLLEWRQRLIEGAQARAKREALLAALRQPPADGFQDQLRACSPFVGGPFSHLAASA